MFQVDEYVAYGNSGVCKVLEIGTPDIDGIEKNKLYYKLQPIYSKGSMIYIPLDNTNTQLRRIITREEALFLIDEIPKLDIIRLENDKMREMKLKEALRKYNCREWLRMIKTLYEKNQQKLAEGKKIGNTDMRYLHEAEECLYGELSIPLGISKDKMSDFIKERVKLITMV